MFEPGGGASEAAGQYLAQYTDISLTTQSIPLALWGRDKMSTVSPPQADEQLIDDALVGLELRTRPGPRPWETPVLDLKVLAYDRYRKNFNWSDVEPAEALPGFGDATISNTIAKPEVVQKRNQILTALIESGRRTLQPEEIQLDQLAQNAEIIFQALPAMARVGQYPPRDYPET